MSQFTNNWNGQNGMMNNMGQQGTIDYSMQQQMMSRNNQQPAMPSMQMPSPNMQGWKTYSPPPQVPPLIGRWVNSFEEIKPQDVPMDGSMCFFPQTDGSCVYAMVWSNDGKIAPYRFVPEKNDPPAVQQQALPVEMNDILKGYESISMRVADRLDSFDKRLDEILTATQTRPTRAKASNTSDKEDK